MLKSKISEAVLSGASKLGEARAAAALSKLAKRKVEVITLGAKVSTASEALKALALTDEHEVIAYAEVLSGANGISLLTMGRKNALDFVDLFNNRPRGTTISMQEIDRSTIRETLNILSNAYITELAKELGQMVLLSVPRMLTKEGLVQVVQGVDKESTQSTAMFRTELKLEEAQYRVELFFFFMADSD